MISRHPIAHFGWLIGSIGISLILSSCGQNESQLRGQTQNDSANTTAENVRLAKSDNDQVLSSLVVNLDENGLLLSGGTPNSDGSWTVDLEHKEKVETGIAPKKYLRVKGEMKIPAEAEMQMYPIGCLYVELVDNVYYREKTWLRVATSGIVGNLFSEVQLPLEVEMGTWQSVPKLPESITLAEFAGNTVKKMDSTLCFRLDYSNAPAQNYRGEIIIQYLRPGKTDNPPACSNDNHSDDCKPCADGETPPMGEDPTAKPMEFKCSTAPLVLNSKQSTTFEWAVSHRTTAMDVVLTADPSTYKGDLGKVAVSGLKATYTAPDKVPQAVRIIATGRPSNDEYLPAFCEVKLVADEDIGVPDDGEVKGLKANVFKLVADTQKLPDFSKMTGVSTVIVPNLDIPERAFSAGFPGVKDLFEWFGIRFTGRLLVATTAEYEFNLNADDGAILYIDGQKIIDNDGVHPTRSVTGKVTLKAGAHDIKVDYFQGPRYHITLQLLWRTSAQAGFIPVPPEAFARPLQ